MEDYEKIEKIILFLEKNHLKQPSLEEIGNYISISPFHLQRLFKRWTGISPKQFLQYLTLKYAKTKLDNSTSLLDVSLESGLSGPGRLHDLFVTFEAVTPGEYRKKGENIQIEYGIHSSPFGYCLIGTTTRGICWLSFFGHEGRKHSLDELKQQWKKAKIKENPTLTAGYINRIFGSGKKHDAPPLSLYLKGTNFQIKVWEALLKLPPAGLVSYEYMANSIGKPNSVRAVASAIGQNPVSYLIPCHRVLRKTGEISGYRWGSARKKAIIAWETGSAQSLKNPINI